MNEVVVITENKRYGKGKNNNENYGILTCR
jgi:hypothetical protein